MDGARALLHIAARSGNPVIFQISPTAFHGVTENPSAVAVPAQHSTLFHPQNIRVHVAANIEGKMTNEGCVPLERHPRGLFFRSTDMNVGECVVTYDRIKAAVRFDDRHRFSWLA